MHAEDQHRQAGEFLLQLLERVDAIAIRHRNIEQEHIPGLLSRQAQCLGAIVGFAGDQHVFGFGKDLLEALAHDGVVVGDQDIDFLGHVRTACAAIPLPSVVRWRATSGTRSIRWVPPCSAAPMVNSPPRLDTRSRIPRRPNDLGFCMSSCEMPRPLSLISSRMLPLSRLKRITTSEAWACLATLVSASCAMRKRASEVSGSGSMPSSSHCTRQGMQSAG
jgi:hypothetical protein